MAQVLIGLGLALLVLQIPRGQAVLRVAAILPIVLAPVVVGLFWRTLVLAPDFGLVDVLTRVLGLGSHNWLGDPQLALVSVIAIHTWQWTPFAFLVILASLASLPPDIYEAARIDRANAWRRFVHITLPLIRPAIVIVIIMRMMVALSAFAAIFAATGGGPDGDRDPEPLRLSDLVQRIQSRLRRGAARRAAGGHAGCLVPACSALRRARHDERAPRVTGARLPWRGAAAGRLGVPGAVGLLTSLKTERDVLAYPPTVIFDADARQLSRRAVRLRQHPAEPVVEPDRRRAATLLTMLFAIPAAYALARLALPGKRASGFYVLATQMLPPVGLIIPVLSCCSKIGSLDTYPGMIVIYLTFSLPFAIWLMVSYFEDIPREMEEAALLDRAGRLRALWYVILPQVRGGIAVTMIFVFLNAWNEFLFAVVLGGNRVRPVTVAMYNFISVEQTLWAKLAAAAMLAMAPVIVLGFAAQRHIVKGLTVGAVKGGGRR